MSDTDLRKENVEFAQAQRKLLKLVKGKEKLEMSW